MCAFFLYNAYELSKSRQSVVLRWAEQERLVASLPSKAFPFSYGVISAFRHLGERLVINIVFAFRPPEHAHHPSPRHLHQNG